MSSVEKIQSRYPKGKVVGVATEGLNETSLKDAMRKATPRGLGADLFLDLLHRRLPRDRNGYISPLPYLP